jgi:hypothetical protein
LRTPCERFQSRSSIASPAKAGGEQRAHLVRVEARVDDGGHVVHRPGADVVNAQLARERLGGRVSRPEDCGGRGGICLAIPGGFGHVGLIDAGFARGCLALDDDAVAQHAERRVHVAVRGRVAADVGRRGPERSEQRAHRELERLRIGLDRCSANGLERGERCW